MEQITFKELRLLFDTLDKNWKTKTFMPMDNSIDNCPGHCVLAVQCGIDAKVYGNKDSFIIYKEDYLCLDMSDGEFTVRPYESFLETYV
jgi:hypothetical protein